MYYFRACNMFEHSYAILATFEVKKEGIADLRLDTQSTFFAKAQNLTMARAGLGPRLRTLH